jgi:hypothetical protein
VISEKSLLKKPIVAGLDIHLAVSEDSPVVLLHTQEQLSTASCTSGQFAGHPHHYFKYS